LKKRKLDFIFFKIFFKNKFKQNKLKFKNKIKKMNLTALKLIFDFKSNFERFSCFKMIIFCKFEGLIDLFLNNSGLLYNCMEKVF